MSYLGDRTQCISLSDKTFTRCTSLLFCNTEICFRTKEFLYVLLSFRMWNILGLIFDDYLWMKRQANSRFKSCYSQIENVEHTDMQDFSPCPDDLLTGLWQYNTIIIHLSFYLKNCLQRLQKCVVPLVIQVKGSINNQIVNVRL
jgi:hypothetical protein